MNVGDGFQLDQLVLKNRFVMAPLKTALNQPGGKVTEEAETFDTVILCSGMEPETALADHLQDFPAEVVVIGDADTPSNIDHAFSQGVAAGNRL